MFGQGLFNHRRRNNSSKIYNDTTVIMGAKKHTEIEPLNAGGYDYEYDIDDDYDDDDDECESNHNSSSFKGRWSTCKNYCNQNYISYFSNDKLKHFFRWFMDYAYYEFRISVTFFIRLFLFIF